VGVQLRPLHLTELREDLERAAAGLLHERPVTFRWQADGVPAVSADRTKLRVILFNLLVNAAKFTPAGEITVDAGCDGDDVWIAVRDTGVGIDPREHADIFESFRQGDAARASGTGLGLTIARRYAALMGGDLGVSSESGNGSVFTLRLQRAEEQSLSGTQLAVIAS
jgi:signal transduction histidine kinase